MPKPTKIEHPQDQVPLAAWAACTALFASPSLLSLDVVPPIQCFVCRGPDINEFARDQQSKSRRF